MNFSKLLLLRRNSLSNVIFGGCRAIGTSDGKYALVNGQKPDWNRAVSEAEKIVDYPTSFLNLKWLFTDEIAHFALHLRKLVGSNHPLLKTAKTLLYNNMQAWGLIVLLVSKAAGHSANIPDLQQDKAVGVLHSQRALAEATEMIKMSHLVHKAMVNLQPSVKQASMENSGDMMFGNKMALLSGDILLSSSFWVLAGLRNQDLFELMCSAGRDLTESEFVEPRDKQNFPLPAKPRTEQFEYMNIGDSGIEPLVVSNALGIAEAEWTLRNVLSAGSLLGKSCQGTLKLAGHPEDLQGQGYLFGKHLALAWQACLDREPFMYGATGPYSLICAPVLFHLQHDHSLYIEIERGVDNVDDVDYEKIRKAVMEGPGLDRTKQLQREHSCAALDVLNELPPSDARMALANMIIAMQGL